MAADPTFRVVLIVSIVALFPMMAYFRLRSQATREPLDRRQEGWPILLTLRPAGVLFFGGLFTYVASPAMMRWSSMPLPVSARWLGVLVAVAAWGLLFWTLRNLGPNLTDTVVTRRKHTLVTNGPYRYVRHPFYDAVGLWMLASALMTSNWFLLATGTLVFILFAVRLSTEEQNLLARFGDEYRLYRERTGRFLPWSARATGPEGGALPHA